MLQVNEGIHEVDSSQLVGHVHVVGGVWVAVPKEHVVHPLRDHALRVHQVPDGVENGLEVVLLRFPPHQNVKALVAVARVHHVGVVLRRVQVHFDGSLGANEAHAGLPDAGEDVVVVVSHVNNLCAPHTFDGVLREERLLAVVVPHCRGASQRVVDLLRRVQGDEEHDIMLTQLVPFLLRCFLEDSEVDGDDRPDVVWLDLPDVRRPDVLDGEVLYGAGHTGAVQPLVEHLALLILPWVQADNGILNVLADLVRGLEPEQIEVPQEVVMESQELQVELRQGQRGLVHVHDLRNHVEVPQ
mmetsp:Transcript_109014/g.188754  ORF Transcript_109014/g.188754 Transcript_109014/m.188754 type:complete len:299 (-) Transcript_109014:1113-2009(-)